ncbi:MAG: hypothetical protein WAV72_10050 [Bradyrhizobium sp.]
MFEMSLKDGLLDRLAQQRWWRDLLAYRDPDNGQHFFVAVRKDYLSVYFLGKAIFKKIYENKKGAIVATVDRRYFDGSGSARGDLIFDGEMLGGSSGTGRRYSSSADLAEWAKIIKSYPPGKAPDPGEKECLAARALDPFVVNLEMALPGFKKSPPEADPSSPRKKKSSTAPRIDMVHLERDGHSARIVFTEAKLFSNTSSLRADPRTGNPAKIFKQIDDYANYIRLNEPAIREAYHQACKYLIAIRSLQGVPVDRLLLDAAENVGRITVEHEPRLLIFRTNKDKAMRDADWEPHRQSLIRCLKCEIVPSPG